MEDWLPVPIKHCTAGPLTGYSRLSHRALAELIVFESYSDMRFTIRLRRRSTRERNRCRVESGLGFLNNPASLTDARDRPGTIS